MSIVALCGAVRPWGKSLDMVLKRSTGSQGQMLKAKGLNGNVSGNALPERQRSNKCSQVRGESLGQSETSAGAAAAVRGWNRHLSSAQRQI